MSLDEICVFGYKFIPLAYICNLNGSYVTMTRNPHLQEENDNDAFFLYKNGIARVIGTPLFQSLVFGCIFCVYENVENKAAKKNLGFPLKESKSTDQQAASETFEWFTIMNLDIHIHHKNVLDDFLGTKNVIWIPGRDRIVPFF